MPGKSSAADAPATSFPRKEPLTVLFHLLGTVPFDQYLALQRRLVYELGEETRRRFPVLICEHPPLITVGRRGSRAHIRLSGEQLRWRQLAVRWVSRGGGCVLHGPGQLSIYPLVPLAHVGWTLGQHLRRLQQGLQNALQSLTVTSQVGQHDWGIWGRTGQLARVGIGVRNDITQYGAFLNVNPSMSSHHYLETPQPPETGISEHPTPQPKRVRTGMSSLLAERRQGVRMTDVRAALMEHLSAAWEAQNYHIVTGHPFLERSPSANRGTNARAS